MPLLPSVLRLLVSCGGLNFKCRNEDVGKPKAEVAAERVMQRVSGVTVTVHVGMIQDKPMEFYEQFTVFILGLDSIDARRYMNGIACSFLGAAKHLCVQMQAGRELLMSSVWKPVSASPGIHTQTIDHGRTPRVASVCYVSQIVDGLSTQVNHVMS